MIDWQSVIIQLGISGLIVYTGYQVAMKLIEKWAASDSERTKALNTSEAARTLAISEGFRADTAAHSSIVTAMNSLAHTFARVEGKLDTVLDLTPVRPMRIEPSSSVVVNFDPPPDSQNGVPEDHRPKIVQQQRTPLHGTPISPGLHGPTKRPKTQG